MRSVTVGIPLLCHTCPALDVLLMFLLLSMITAAVVVLTVV
jgi:hypothetical protein